MAKNDSMTGIVLETSASCQLNCPNCFLRSYDERPQPALMGPEVVRAVAPYLAGMDSLDLTGWGEPLLNPDLFEIIETVKDAFSGKITMTTNGLLLDREKMERIIALGLDTVCVSVDASSESRYRAARKGGDFKILHRVLDEFATLRDGSGKERPLLFGTYLLRKDALSDLDEFVGLVSAHGFDGVVFQQMTGIFSKDGLEQATHSAYYYNDFDSDRLDRAVGAAKKVAPPGFTIVGPERVAAKRVCDCGGFDITRPFVTAPGDVSVCCAMAYPCSLMRRDRSIEKTAAITFGNVLEKPLPEIWEDPEYVKAREEIRSGEVPQACGDCIALYISPGEVWTAPEED